MAKKKKSRAAVAVNPASAHPRKLADTMESAAAQLGVSKSVVQRAKREGCDAFTGGRVDLTKLSKWLESHPLNPQEATMETAKLHRELQRIERAAIENLNLKNELLRKEDVLAAAQTAVSEFRQTLQSSLIDQLPGLCAGLSAEEQRKINTETFDRIMKHLESWAAKYE